MRSISLFVLFLFSHSAFAQCTLEIESMVPNPVSCYGLSDGEVVVNVTGASGVVSFSSGGSGSVISPVQGFNTSGSLSTASGSGPINQWWSPSSCTGGPFIYSSTLGCPGGAAVYNGGFSGFTGCFIRSPQLNMNGIDHVNITFDITHSFSPSRPNDRIRVYVWVNNGYMSVPANYSINGTTGQFLNFNQPRNCTPVSVDINLSGIPTNNRSDFLFYIEANCQYSNCSTYQVIVDNIVISQAAPTQASNVFTGLPAGNFTVTVTDGAGCSASQTVMVPQPEILTLTATSTPVTILGGNDGTATATAQGGNAGYQFNWSTNPIQTGQTAIGLSPGTYSVNVVDSKGCAAQTSVTVGQPSCEGLIITSVQSNDLSCFGANDGSLAIEATSPNGALTFTLNNQDSQASGIFSHLAAGIYTVQVNDAAGCSVSTANSIEITEPEPLNVTILQFENALISSGFSSYQWFLNGNAIENATDSIYFFTSNGAYYVLATDVNGCTGASNTIDVTTVSIGQTLEPETEVFPNPFSDYIILRTKHHQEPISYRIYSVTGQLMAGGTLNSNTTIISSSELKSGMYNLNIISNRKLLNYRLIKM
jgi:hypothetical protein